MPIFCPHCGSENVQKLSIIHAAGISQGVTTGVGSLGKQLILNVGKSEHQSSLSQSVAPPNLQTNRKTTLLSTGSITILFAFIVGTISLFLAFIVGLIGLAIVTFARSKKTLNQDMEASAINSAWSKTFMCLVCGHRFIPPIELGFK